MMSEANPANNIHKLLEKTGADIEPAQYHLLSAKQERAYEFTAN